MIAWGMPRFYCPEPLITGETLVLPDEVVHHVRVLRLATGSEVVLFNGQGGEYQATLELAGKNAHARIGQYRALERESSLNLHLAQALVSSDKMDWLLQKAVELGVNGITPVLTRRTNINLSGERLEKRQQHWQGVVHSSCEQCGRNQIPRVEPLATLESWALALTQTAMRYLLDPAGVPLDQVGPAPAQPVHLVVGPEGGFDLEERTWLMAQGFKGVRLGPRILRTETAALAMVAALQALAGDFSE